MNLSKRWLHDYVNLDVSDQQFADDMTLSGSKVESFETEGADIKNVIVGKVVSLVKHPDSDHLWICQIDVGAKDNIQIVTGAQNLKVNDVVPVAMDDSFVSGGHHIKKGKLRGVESNGMLCSLGELGLTIHDFPYAIEDGIFVLGDDCDKTLGKDIHEAIGLDDVITEFEITSNRADCLSITGLAREAAATFDSKLVLPTILQNIREKLIAGVEKRLDADAPVGFLLSGGLDSSLVCSIAAKKLGKPIRTFAIGMDTDAIDLKYARQTADYLGSEHHEIIINREMVLSSLEEVIRLLGTWDITTIRASMGMYLLCKAIHEQTDVRVLLTGEISDELFGYKYTDYAPTADAFQQESQKRIRELYMYDVLRADRCISANSIEARVPFGDLDFVRYVMAIDPEKKLNSYGKGKYLLRKAFEGDWLPPEILWREKAAFSDAVGHSMVDDIKEYAESLYTDEEFQLRRANYSAHCMPFTKESLFYREIFEKYYHDQSRTIVGFWMPNKAWPGCNVNDPSARVLANYGASGV